MFEASHPFPSGPRPSASQANLQCLIWDQFSPGIRQKFQLRERTEPVNLRNAAEYLIDEGYTHIAELVTLKLILAADLEVHPVCFPEYIHKLKEAKQKENSLSKDIRFLF